MRVSVQRGAGWMLAVILAGAGQQWGQAQNSNVPARPAATFPSPSNAPASPGSAPSAITPAAAALFRRAAAGGLAAPTSGLAVPARSPFVRSPPPATSGAAVPARPLAAGPVGAPPVPPSPAPPAVAPFPATPSALPAASAVPAVVAKPGIFPEGGAPAAVATNVPDGETIETDYEPGDTNLPALVPITPGAGTADDLVGIKYEALDLEEVLAQYAVWTGRALMRAPDVPTAKITLKCPKRLPKREALLAIESVLAMHGVALIPMGDNFLKVVQITAARQSGMATGSGPLEGDIADTDHLVSRIVELKHLEIAEAQNTIQNLLHAYGKSLPLERVNCLLITESASNLKRILEILAVIDQPLESREELRLFPIRHAKASEIQSKIEAIIADVQAKETARSQLVRQQLAAARLPQPFQPLQPVPAPSQPTVVDVAQPALERGLIRSKVKMVADDRINTLIVITRPEQFAFFDNIIKALDQQIEPDVGIKVFALEYADAKDVVTVLNNLLGGTGKTDSKAGPASAPMPAALPGLPAAQPAGQTSAAKTARTPSGEIQITGKLSSDVKIIADPRINSLLVMATKTDMAVIEDVLRQIDIMLSQVLIEVVIVEIGLSDKVKVGIDWLQRSMIAYNQRQGGGRSAFLGFGGANRVMSEGDAALRDGSTINRIADLPAGAGSGLTYYFTHFDFNIDAVINMLAASAEARILSTPIILTTDNKEAKIMVGEKRPIVTSTSISGGGVQQSAYQYQDIGIQLEVTPRINKKGFVVMDIKQKIDNKGEDVIIDGNKVPVITTRDFTASIAVNDGRTIVIGGIVTDDGTKSRNKIPFLGDIPLLGVLFRSDAKEQLRRELIVLMTPYVLDTPEKAYAETARRHGQVTEASNLWTRGWSASSLAAPPKETRDERRRREARDAAGKPPALYKSREIEEPRGTPAPARAP